MTPHDPTGPDPTPTDPDPAGVDPAGPELAGDVPEADLPDPVAAPHHDPTSPLMELALTVAEHGMALAKVSGTTHENRVRIAHLETTSALLADLLDRVTATDTAGGVDPAGVAPELAGDFPEGDLPDPVAAPHHDLTARVMELAFTVAEHGMTLAKVPGTTKEHLSRIVRLEATSEAVAGLLDRVAALEPPIPAGPEPAEGPGAPDQQQPEQQAEPEGEPSGGSEVPAFDLRILIDWVRENLATVLERDIPTSKSPNWCRQWWRHPEAIARLEATRRCWLDASAQNANLSVFFQHLDHHLAVLTDERGPFSRCRDGQHTPDPMKDRVLGQDDPDETFYAEFDRLRTAPVATIPTTPAGSHPGGNDPVPTPAGTTGTAWGGGGVNAVDLPHRRNGRAL